MQMAGTKCPFDNVQSGDKKKAFTATVKLIHKAERQWESIMDIGGKEKKSESLLDQLGH